MHRKLGKAFFAQAVEQRGLTRVQRPDHYITIVKDVAWAIKTYIEDTR